MCAVDFAPHAEKFGRNLGRALGTTSPHHWYGKTDGDLLKIPLEQFPSVDLLIAGPPCPPFSQQGNHQGLADPRAQVFVRTIDIIGHLAARGESPLLCYILENVKGITHRYGGTPPAIEEVLARLKKAAPHFKIRVLHVNSKEYGLPQSRPRVYIVGTHPSIAGGDITEPPTLGIPGSFTDCLLEPQQVPEHHFQGGLMLQAWDSKLGPFEDVEGPFFQVANVGNRLPDSSRAVDCRDGIVPCITCNSKWWLRVKSGDVAFERWLMPIEALALQGFPTKDPALAAALAGLKDAQVATGAGNAMSVPVVAAILAQVFVKTRLCEAVAAGTRPQDFSSTLVSLAVAGVTEPSCEECLLEPQQSFKNRGWHLCRGSPFLPPP